MSRISDSSKVRLYLICDLIESQRRSSESAEASVLNPLPKGGRTRSYFALAVAASMVLASVSLYTAASPVMIICHSHRSVLQSPLPFCLPLHQRQDRVRQSRSRQNLQSAADEGSPSAATLHCGHRSH